MNRIADLFHIKSRFLRSTHLERDFSDPDALRGYVVTPPAIEGFDRLSRGLAPKSGHRAWRVTGDYGTGKSSFALALAHLLSDEGRGVPPAVRQIVDYRKLGIKRPNLLPVLVTGSRAPLSESLLLALASAIKEQSRRGKPPGIIGKIEALCAKNTGNQKSETALVEVLSETARYLRDSEKADGILIILDELGKFLEFAALHPDRQDVYFLQALAEVASRSGAAPIFVVGLLHQGFNAYAEQLSLPSQKEWEKVAGRFEEILFDQPLEQTTSLVANALNVRKDRLPRGTISRLERDMERAVSIGWFGAGAPRQRLVSNAAELYPLHPSVIPVLVRLFTRFGQNERSLYSFLLSNEPNALQSFSEQSPKADSFYQVHHLYDYARTAFGHRLMLQSFRSHWNQIESVVDSFPRDQVDELRILKTVAVLNLIDTTSLLASDEAVALAVGGASPEVTSRIKKALKGLQRGKSVLYFRGEAGGYCLWPHTSVNLDRAYHDALKAVPVPKRVAPLIQSNLETRPLVARRHYIETGNLRHFQVQFVAPEDLQEISSSESTADGRVLVALCETEAERVRALEFAKSPTLRSKRNLLIAVPQPLKGLASLVAEVQRWEWVLQNTPELNHDAYAQEEVTRQLAACRQVLSKRLQNYVGLRQFGETLGLQWFHRGKRDELGTGRALLEKLSRICDDVYSRAPQINNELVNRHTLSSAAAAARLRLIERILAKPTEPLLGMDKAAKPPEMSMYLSVLKAAKLHRQIKGTWTLTLPDENDDPCNLRPILTFMRETLERQANARIKLDDLFAALRQPPFGIRDGIGPLLLAVFAMIHEQDVAFYENEGFVKHVSGQEFHRLIKASENFELQYCKIAGVRTIVFDQLFKVLNPGKKKTKRIDLLDVVRPLCIFASQLPAFVVKTSHLSREAIAVRDALLRAEEPATLIFQTLPEACGCECFESSDAPSQQRVKKFVSRLRDAIEELRLAYPELLRKMKAEFAAAFDRPGTFGDIRQSTADSAQRFLHTLTEPRLKAFCLRVADNQLEEQEWLESLGSYVCSKPPSKWIDQDLISFQEEIPRYSRQFGRVESTSFASQNDKSSVHAMRVSITCQDGMEVDQVVHLDHSELDRVTLLEKKILNLVSDEQRLGILAATRAIWSQLRQPATNIASS
jgi:hypothetical protein